MIKYLGNPAGNLEGGEVHIMPASMGGVKENQAENRHQDWGRVYSVSEFFRLSSSFFLGPHNGSNALVSQRVGSCPVIKS